MRSWEGSSGVARQPEYWQRASNLIPGQRCGHKVEVVAAGIHRPASSSHMRWRVHGRTGSPADTTLQCGRGSQADTGEQQPGGK